MLATTRCVSLLLPLAVFGITGCYEQSAGTGGAGEAAAPVVAEGVIFSVEWVMGDGKTTAGFTRLNNPKAAPGSESSWNIDAYGRLTDQYLIITYPQQKDLGPRVIPADRLVEIRFGDAGIKRVSETPSHE